MPELIIPHYISDMYKEVLRDADLLPKVYKDPQQCIAESIAGLDMPGLHLQLVEQNRQDKYNKSYLTSYYPRGNNAMRVLDDNELALTFRHVDGFFNYFMLRDAVKFMSSDTWQAAQGEVYKAIGNLSLENMLTDNWSIVSVYKGVVYSAIDGNNFAYNKLASENQFTVRCKFVDYESSYYYKGKAVGKEFFNHNQGE